MRCFFLVEYEAVKQARFYWMTMIKVIPFWNMLDIFQFEVLLQLLQHQKKQSS